MCVLQSLVCKNHAQGYNFNCNYTNYFLKTKMMYYFHVFVSIYVCQNVSWSPFGILFGSFTAAEIRVYYCYSFRVY